MIKLNLPFDTFLDRAANLATLFMRWTRPFVFAGLFVLFVMGFWFNEGMIAWLEAVANTPDWLADLITVLVVGLAIEKFTRQVGEAIKVVKET